MFYCKELDRNFENKTDLIKELRRHKDDIISFKKANIYKSVDKGISVTAKPLDSSKINTTTKGISIDEDYYYLAVNSTKVLDSHLDLHVNGIWNKTVKEHQGRNYLVDTHVLSIKTTIARKEYIEMLTAVIPFALLGKPYDGDTEVLIYKIRKDKIISTEAKEWLDSGDDIECSVRMQYVDISFAVNSDDKEDIKFKDNYDNYINQIANKEDFDTEIVYFWIVKQAKNVLESSLVLFGSNSTTGQIEESAKFQPSNDTEKQDSEPSNDTQKNQKEFYLNLLKATENEKMDN